MSIETITIYDNYFQRSSPLGTNHRWSSEVYGSESQRAAEAAAAADAADTDTHTPPRPCDRLITSRYQLSRNSRGPHHRTANVHPSLANSGVRLRRVCARVRASTTACMPAYCCYCRPALRACACDVLPVCVRDRVCSSRLPNLLRRVSESHILIEQNNIQHTTV